jgi:hypothetical protein
MLKLSKLQANNHCDSTKYTREYDPSGDRTLGIITKPDYLHEGSESERHYVDLAQNKDVSFRLGWHILRNRDYQERNNTAEERDRAEEDFFSKGIWTCLSPNQLGIRTLKPKLSHVLKGEPPPTMLPDSRYSDIGKMLRLVHTCISITLTCSC